MNIRRKYIAIKNFIIDSIDCLAPYTVYNAQMRAQHNCWTWKAALEWLSCYDAEGFGETSVHNFNGELIAMKGN